MAASYLGASLWGQRGGRGGESEDGGEGREGEGREGERREGGRGKISYWQRLTAIFQSMG